MILSKKRITKVLIRLRGCAGWSAPVLFANSQMPEDRFSRMEAHIIWTAKAQTSWVFDQPDLKKCQLASFKFWNFIILTGLCSWAGCTRFENYLVTAYWDRFSHDFPHMGSVLRKSVSGFPTKYDSNQSAHVYRLLVAGILKLCG